MALDTTQEITLRLPTELIERIEQIGPPLQPLAEKMLDYSTEELRAVVEARLSKKDQTRFSKLLQFNRERLLTESEDAEAESLLDKITALTMESAVAR